MFKNHLENRGFKFIKHWATDEYDVHHYIYMLDDVEYHAWFSSRIAIDLIKYRDVHGIKKYDYSIPNHPLINKKIFDKSKKKEYTIESIHKHNYPGKYLIALIRDENDSHGMMTFEIINCVDPIIHDEYKRDKKNIILI